ncbi:MAG TPA: HEAT repeat domain-containing protein [Vicinamibacterales bacterium]|nr:HEAT repeat domain-containing protein [Vicinamibacterales bacterium]
MFSRTVIVFVIVGLTALSLPQAVRAQAARGAAPAIGGDAAVLAKGWNAVATGNAAEADRLSDSLLKASPRNHDALALRIAARVSARTVAGALNALDAYEGWLGRVDQREDVFLLEPVARGILSAYATSTDARVRTRALELLAAAGDDQARRQLGVAAGARDGGSTLGDDALVRLGDTAAAQRLVSRVKSANARDVSASIDALAAANVGGAAGVIAGALAPPNVLPTRMAAARALGILGDASAIPRLKEALTDPDPPVRLLAAASLMRLGDNAGAELVQKFENSPVGDLRLLAVEAGAAGNPSGPWVGVATSVLNDPDPLVRLRAAELLVKHASDSGQAREVLTNALTDSNPAMAEAAARQLHNLPAGALGSDPVALRKLLRSPSPFAQLEAAGTLLRIAGSVH